MATFTLTIVTAESQVFSEEVDSLVAPGIDGQLGILPSHAPLMTQLQPGEMTVRSGGNENVLAVTGGFMEVLNNKVTILADTAEMDEEIDLDQPHRRQSDQRKWHGDGDQYPGDQYADPTTNRVRRFIEHDCKGRQRDRGNKDPAHSHRHEAPPEGGAPLRVSGRRQVIYCHSHQGACEKRNRQISSVDVVPTYLLGQQQDAECSRAGVEDHSLTTLWLVRVQQRGTPKPHHESQY